MKKGKLQEGKIYIESFKKFEGDEDVKTESEYIIKFAGCNCVTILWDYRNLQNEVLLMNQKFLKHIDNENSHESICLFGCSSTLDILTDQDDDFIYIYIIDKKKEKLYCLCFMMKNRMLFIIKNYKYLLSKKLFSFEKYIKTFDNEKDEKIEKKIQEKFENNLYEIDEEITKEFNINLDDKIDNKISNISNKIDNLILQDNCGRIVDLDNIV
jgi:hypothetical protein